MDNEFKERLDAILTLQGFDEMRENIVKCIELVYLNAIKNGNASLEIKQCLGTKYKHLSELLDYIEGKTKEDEYTPPVGNESVEDNPIEDDEVGDAGGDS